MGSTDARVRVRILQLGRRVLDHQAVAGTTLAGVLAEVGLSSAPAGLDVRVNGAPAEPGRVLAEGDVVTLIPRIKGGQAGRARPAGAGRRA
jgi:sulfur carrier protein ThiS